MPRSTTSRVFVDANVLFSGVHSPQGTPGRLLRHAASGTFQAVLSSTVLAEALRNLNLKLSHPPAGLSSLLAAGMFEIVPDPPPPDVDVWAARGFRSDSDIIAAAIAAEVEYLCTGDRKLLRELPDYHPSFEVVSPRALLAVLEAGTARP